MNSFSGGIRPVWPVRWRSALGRACGPFQRRRVFVLVCLLGCVSRTLVASEVVGWGSGTYGQTNVPPNLTNVVAIAGGAAHSLILRADGTVTAWGDNSWGQRPVPPGLTNVTAIGGGAWHSLALRADGTAVAWGWNFEEQSRVPRDLTNLVAIAAGGYHDLALKADGTVVAWGDNHSGQTTVRTNMTDVVAVAAGFIHSLALKSDGQVVAWGYNGHGQTNVPADLRNVVAIAGGGFHSLALKRDGTVAAWGDNSEGQSAVPAGLTDVIAVAAGRFHSLALKADGTVVAWGYNYVGQASVPEGLTNVVAIAAGDFHSLALVGDQPPFLTTPLVDRTALPGASIQWMAAATGTRPLSYQWKLDGVDLPAATNAVLTLTNLQPSQAGLYSVVVSNAVAAVTSPSARLTLVPLLLAMIPQSQNTFLGANVSFSVTAQGPGPFAYQWHFKGTDLPAATNSTLMLNGVQSRQAGAYSVTVRNGFGAVISPDALLTLSPLLIATLPQSRYTFKGATVAFSVGVQGASPLVYTLHFTGADLPGATNSVLVLNDVQINQTGAYSVTVTNAYGEFTSPEANLLVTSVPAWGANLFGQTNILKDLTNVTAIAAGMGHSLALRSDGQVVVWGQTNYGQTDLPAGLTNVIAIAAGDVHSLVLKGDGTVVAWGAGTTNSGTWPNYGQSLVPSGLTNVVAISGGAVHSLALKSDGTVVAWGDNYYGQSNVPAGLTNVVAISAGGFHNLALRSDGTVVAWDRNSDGQTDVPSGLANMVAIAGGRFHSLALGNDGTVIGWGMTRVPEQITGVVAMAAGTDISLALRADGTLYSWYIGNYIVDPGSPPPGLTNVVAISTKGGPGDGLALIGDGPPLLRTPLTNVLRSDATFSVTLPSQSGRVYALEFKVSLTDDNWTALPLVAGNGRLLKLSDSSATGAQRFYRVRRW